MKLSILKKFRSSPTVLLTKFENKFIPKRLWMLKWIRV